MRILNLILIIAMLCPVFPALAQPAEVMLYAPDEQFEWGILPTLMSMRVPVERYAGDFPAGQIDGCKLIVVGGSTASLDSERDRLLSYVRGGGRLVIWMAKDMSEGFLPYRLALGEKPPTEVVFGNSSHILVRALSGKSFKEVRQYQDWHDYNELFAEKALGDWNRGKWTILASSPEGPVMLVSAYGSGEILVMQCGGTIYINRVFRQEMIELLVKNLIDWAGLRRTVDLGKRSIRDVVLLVAKRQMHPIAEGEWKKGEEQESMNSKPPSGIKWTYPWGVTLYGLLRAGEVTGEKALIEFVNRHNEIVAGHYAYLDWQEKSFGKKGDTAGLPPVEDFMSNGSMGSQIIEAVPKHGGNADSQTMKMLRTTSKVISSVQSRLPDGSICRLARDMNPFDETTVWVDDLYMSCPFLVRWGTYTKDSRYWDDAAKQIMNYSKLLQDKDGIYFHGYFMDQKMTGPAKWGRGNGWAIVATVEVLSQLPEDHPDRPELISILGRQIEGLKRLQSPSGMWRQLLDREDSWEESSCTAMYTYAIARAVNRGWIDKGNLKHANKAFDALKNHISVDGSVTDACVGTGLRLNLKSYYDRPRTVSDGHEAGAVLLAGAELLAAGLK